MNRATLLFTKSGKGPAHDDVINVFATEHSSDIYQVIYKSEDYKTRKTFLTTESKVLDYIEDILKSMTYDTEPFENIQVNTLVHPAVLYHVSDLDDMDVRNLILNVVQQALRFNITNTD